MNYKDIIYQMINNPISSIIFEDSSINRDFISIIKDDYKKYYSLVNIRYDYKIHNFLTITTPTLLIIDLTKISYIKISNIINVTQNKNVRALILAKYTGGDSYHILSHDLAAKSAIILTLKNKKIEILKNRYGINLANIDINSILRKQKIKKLNECTL